MKKSVQEPTINADYLSLLTPGERDWVRTVLMDPKWIKLMSIVQRFKPSANCAKGGSGDRDEFSDARANARLGEMRGWDMYQIAIFKALNDFKPEKPQAQASYPDSGRIDANWGSPPERKTT